MRPFCSRPASQKLPKRKPPEFFSNQSGILGYKEPMVCSPSQDRQTSGFNIFKKMANTNISQKVAPKRRTVGETLEANPSASKLSQLNIIGSNSGGAATAAAESNEKLKSSGPKIIEISDDGTFEIPDEPEESDEPPELDLSMEGVNLSSNSSVEVKSGGDELKKVQEEEGPSVMDEMMAAANAARKVVKDKAKAEETRVKKEFGGGLKKGFFNSAPAKGKNNSTNKKATSKPMETIKPKAKEVAPKDKLVLDEVQQAMKSSASPMSKLLTDGEWMTPDLLQKFATNPKLAKGLSDPRFQAAIAEMQKDPKAAMLKFQQDEELSEFLKEFFSTMGDHFTAIGTKKKDESNGSNNTKASSKSSQQPQAHVKPVERPLSDAAMKKAAQSTVPPPSKQEQDQMNEILKNEELRELLMDPEMQKVMMSCSEPGRLQYVMQDPKWGPKIRILAKHGLVKIER